MKKFRNVLILVTICSLIGSIALLCGCNIKEETLSYNIFYIAEEGGYIDGQTEQIIASGDNAEPVMAVPNEGYEFVKWTDGQTTPERKDKNIIADKTVTAEFEKIKLNVTYNASTGGTIDGAEEQEIEYGNDAETVIAVPETGYRFVKWSDGQITPEHQEKNVTADITIEAIFEKI